MFRSLAKRAARRALGDKRSALLVRLVSENAWTYRWHYAAAVLMMLLVAGTASAIALMIEQVTDEVFFERRAEYVPVVAGWVAVVFIARGAAMFGQTVLLARIGNRIVAGLQERIYEHVLTQGMGFYAMQGAGELATRITHNANAARAALMARDRSMGRAASRGTSPARGRCLADRRGPAPGARAARGG